MSLDIHNQDRKWSELKIGDDIYMISTTKTNNKIEVLLTNLIELWKEILTADIILRKSQKFNQLLNVNSIDCNETVANILSNISEHVIRATVDEIHLRAHIANIPFKFTLNLEKASPTEFYNIITKPLCLTSVELLRQNHILLDLVKKKDIEIAEYKAEGAELIRKNIETKPLDEAQLKVNSAVSNEVNCLSIFSTMTNIYNDLPLQSNLPVASVSSSTSDSSTINNETQEESSGDQKNTTRIVTQKSSRRRQAKTGANYKRLSDNEKHMNIVQKRPKGSKKGLQGFI